MPDTRATRFPVRFPADRPSSTKQAMPQKTKTQAMTSSFFARSRKNSQRKRMTKAGAVYWMRMVLAAVVSLLARA